MRVPNAIALHPTVLLPKYLAPPVFSSPPVVHMVRSGCLTARWGPGACQSAPLSSQRRGFSDAMLPCTPDDLREDLRRILAANLYIIEAYRQGLALLLASPQYRSPQ